MELIRTTDSELLARFAEHRDEDAFNELLRRHGSMVYSVANRILTSADADDATQAVFLTLAHKAAELRREQSLASWLHRVTVRVALDLRKSAAARQRREQHVAATRETPAPLSPEDRELFAQLDAELNLLPEKYRAPLVLHHFQGLTQDETAQRLKRKAGTISMQLNRARDLLRQRLERRNAATVGTAMALLLAARLHASEMPAALAQSTLNHATLIAAGNAAATGSVAALTKGALSMLFVEKIKSAALVALTATAVLVASGAVAYRTFAEETPEKVEAPAPVESNARPASTDSEPRRSFGRRGPSRSESAATTTTAESTSQTSTTHSVNGVISSGSLSANSRTVDGKTEVEVKRDDKVVAKREYTQPVTVATSSKSTNGAVEQQVTITDAAGKVLEVIKYPNADF